MKKLFIMSIAFISIFLGCQKQVKVDETKNDQNTVQKDDSNDIIKKYEKEGFIDKNTFAVIIVRPLNSSYRKDEIENEAKKRAFVMLQKYIINDNKRLKKNDKIIIQNSINNNSELKKMQDTEKSRDIYLLIIKEEGFYRKIKELGI